MLFRGKFLSEGKILVRRTEIDLVRSVQDGVEDWKGSFTGLERKLLAGQTYQLVLENGRNADIQLEQAPADTGGAEKVKFTISGGFR